MTHVTPTPTDEQLANDLRESLAYLKLAVERAKHAGLRVSLRINGLYHSASTVGGENTDLSIERLTQL